METSNQWVIYASISVLCLSLFFFAISLTPNSLSSSFQVLAVAAVASVYYLFLSDNNDDKKAGNKKEPVKSEGSASQEARTAKMSAAPVWQAWYR